MLYGMQNILGKLISFECQKVGRRGKRGSRQIDRFKFLQKIRMIIEKSDVEIS